MTEKKANKLEAGTTAEKSAANRDGATDAIRIRSFLLGLLPLLYTNFITFSTAAGLFVENFSPFSCAPVQVGFGIYQNIPFHPSGSHTFAKKKGSLRIPHPEVIPPVPYIYSIPKSKQPLFFIHPAQ